MASFNFTNKADYLKWVKEHEDLLWQYRCIELSYGNGNVRYCINRLSDDAIRKEKLAYIKTDFILDIMRMLGLESSGNEQFKQDLPDINQHVKDIVDKYFDKIKKLNSIKD